MARTVARLSAKQRTAMVAAARSFLGVPFKHRGRSRRGVDCVGLVVVALAAVKRTVVDRRHYGRKPEEDGLYEVLCDHLGDPVPMETMRPGDVVLMAVYASIREAHLPNHVGIITEYPGGGFALLHSLAMNKEVIEHRLDDAWASRIRGVWRP